MKLSKIIHIKYLVQCWAYAVEIALVIAGY